MSERKTYEKPQESFPANWMSVREPIMVRGRVRVRVRVKVRVRVT